MRLIFSTLLCVAFLLALTHAEDTATVTGGDSNAGVGLLKRQSQSASSIRASPSLFTFTFVPGGAQNRASSLESVVPFPCMEGCYDVLGTYQYCFINTTLISGAQSNATRCLIYSCTQTFYDQFSQCLNCIVANGNERPFGYYTNSSITAFPTRGSGGGTASPLQSINATLANSLMANLGMICANASSSVTGATTVTATPTTTGPYYTTWTSGATVSVSNWPGLTTFSLVSVVTASAAAPATTSVPANTGTITTTITPTASKTSGSERISSGSLTFVHMIWAVILSSMAIGVCS